MWAACKRFLWRVKQTVLAEKEFSHVQFRCVQVAWDTGPVNTASRSHCHSTQARAKLLVINYCIRKVFVLFMQRSGKQEFTCKSCLGLCFCQCGSGFYKRHDFSKNCEINFVPCYKYCRKTSRLDTNAFVAFFFFFTNCAHASVVLTLLSVHVSGGYVPDPRIDMTCHTPHNKRRTEKITETSSNLKVSTTACIVKYLQTHTH